MKKIKFCEIKTEKKPPVLIRLLTSIFNLSINFASTKAIPLVDAKFWKFSRRISKVWDAKLGRLGSDWLFPSQEVWTFSIRHPGCTLSTVTDDSSANPAAFPWTYPMDHGWWGCAGGTCWLLWTRSERCPDARSRVPCSPSCRALRAGWSIDRRSASCWSTGTGSKPGDQSVIDLWRARSGSNGHSWSTNRQLVRKWFAEKT